MQEKTTTENCRFEFGARTRIAFCLLAVAFGANIVFAQAHPKGSTGLTSDQIENLKKKVEQFLSLDDSNPITHNSHIYYNITVEILPHDVLLDLSERVVKKGIRANTSENLRKAHPDMSESSIEQQQKLEFGRLYSQYAWILWKKGQTKDAFDTITKAKSYISSPTPEDCLRLGVVECGNGKKEQGWNHIIDALMKDTIVEEQDPGYRRALDTIVKDKFGKEKDSADFIAEYRRRNAQMIPNLSLTTLENARINTPRPDEKIMFVNFFSPTCGSCQQEIPGLKQLYERFLLEDSVAFIFILNRPDLKQEAIGLFEKSGISKPVITVLENGSVWDLISAEPTIWITNKAGKVIFRHSGFKRGDELIYERKLQECIRD